MGSNMIQHASAAAGLVGESKRLQQEKLVDETYIRLVRELARISIDHRDYFVVEGDLLFDEDELFFYARRRQLAMRKYTERTIGNGPELGDAQPLSSSTELMAIERNGRPVRWDAGTVLSYCVLKRTFEQEDRYQSIVDAMHTATEDWEAACGVTFAHVKELDDSVELKPEGALFPVREISVDSTMLASAFFPTDAVFRRRILINRVNFYTTSFNRVGVLRHELGHILGFRHEHIRSGAPAACPEESEASAIPLTAYDPQSVMHYYCGCQGTRNLEITESDKVGAQKVYGPPLDVFDVILCSDNDLSGDDNLTQDSSSPGSALTFERDIKPLFREKDRNAMRAFGAFDLWNYDDVRSNAERIVAAVEGGSMPCDAQWPDEKVETFKTWMANGMPA